MPAGTREALVDYVRDEAGWRYRMADERPDDPRHRRSADSLSALADAIGRAPDDHVAFTMLGLIPTERGGDTLVLTAQAQQLVAHYGYAGDPPDPRSFLIALALAQAQGAVQAKTRR